jgi:hypothetical protein
MIYLLFRVHHPTQGDKRLLLDYCAQVVRRIEQLYQECGYQLQPITSETALAYALTPFQIQALAELRRSEELLLLYDTYTEYEVYVTSPWEWAVTQPLPLFELLTQQHKPCLLSIHLEATELSYEERSHLDHATSPEVRESLEGSFQGRSVYTQYQVFARKLRQPYLLRICLAVPTHQTIVHLGQTMLDQLPFSQPMPVLQSPQNGYEWRIALRNLNYLEAMPWGNLRDHTPGTARLRYLTDSQGASMSFHLPTPPEPATSRTQKIKVLLVFANPHTIERPLRLGTETRVIHEAIRLSRYRENIVLTELHAATIHDLSRALLDDEFQIVHIGGHGVSKGLILEDETGRPYRVPQQALANLFQAYNKTLRCVVLNACYSLSQGELITLGVAFTVAMEGRLGDQAAHEFARGFYDALGAGKEIDFAYEEGRRRVGLAIPDDAPFVAKLLKQA